MLFQQLIATLLVGTTLADLSCSDWIPRNWTTPMGALRFYNTSGPLGPGTPQLPANSTATVPFKLASKSALGTVFHYRKCQSKSLGLNSSVTPIECDFLGGGRRSLHAGPSMPEDSPLQRRYSNGECYKLYIDYVQVINPSTGHCLTPQNYLSKYSNLTFGTCNLNPTSYSQIFQAQRYIEYYETDQMTPGPVFNWGATTIRLVPMENVIIPGDGNPPPYWTLTKDNTTIQETTVFSYTQYYSYAVPYGPLTTK